MVYTNLSFGNLIFNFIASFLVILTFPKFMMSGLKKIINNNKYNEIKEWTLKKFLEEIVIFIVAFIIVIPLMSFAYGYINNIFKSKYSITNNNELVLYNTDEYAIVKKCNISDEKLKILSSAYKIDKNNKQYRTVYLRSRFDMFIHQIFNHIKQK